MKRCKYVGYYIDNSSLAFTLFWVFRDEKTGELITFRSNKLTDAAPRFNHRDIFILTFKDDKCIAIEGNWVKVYYEGSKIMRLNKASKAIMCVNESLIPKKTRKRIK